MNSDYLLHEKGAVKPEPTAESSSPQKEIQPLTLNQIQTSLNPATVQQMQQTLGNAAVQRYLVQRNADEGGELDDDVASSINNRRGHGHELDGGIAGRAGDVMGADFSNVNVHTDSHADNLSRSIGAKAFTTGNDIFFREGAYSPRTNEGQHLIAHELTHVVQQGASAPDLQGKMTVNDPNDQYEAEADAIADSVMSHQEDEAQMMEEEEEAVQAMEEEEEAMQMQEMEEEEMMAG